MANTLVPLTLSELALMWLHIAATARSSHNKRFTNVRKKGWTLHHDALIEPLAEEACTDTLTRVAESACGNVWRLNGDIPSISDSKHQMEEM
jgi:hypothetical protein